MSFKKVFFSHVKNDILIKNPLINFLIDRTRHMGINSENFNLIWNIKGPHASSDIQNEI